MKEFSLPALFAREWVEKLRSGDYPQGKNYLTDNGKYCCLGVAGIACGVHPLEMDRMTDFVRFFDGETDEEITRNLPAGMENLPEILAQEQLPEILMGMNDVQRLTFDEIADWIEHNIEFVPPEYPLENA